MQSARILYNSSRLETLLQLRVCVTFYAAQHDGLSPSLQSTASWTESPLHLGQGIRVQKKDHGAALLEKCVPQQQAASAPRASTNQQCPRLHARSIPASDMFAQLGTNVASPHVSADKKIKGSNTGERIQSTASEQAHHR